MQKGGAQRGGTQYSVATGGSCSIESGQQDCSSAILPATRPGKKAPCYKPGTCLPCIESLQARGCCWSLVSPPSRPPASGEGSCCRRGQPPEPGLFSGQAAVGGWGEPPDSGSTPRQTACCGVGATGGEQPPEPRLPHSLLAVGRAERCKPGAASTAFPLLQAACFVCPV